MSKLFGMARVSAKGGFSLFVGQALSTIISAVGAILIARLLGPSEYGLMSIALIFPFMIASFRDLGINSAMVKYLAQYKSENRTEEIRRVLASGILLEITLGAILSFISFSLAGFISTDVFRRPDIKPLIETASLIVFAGSFMTVAESTFIGFEKMEYNSLIMILQSSLKTFLQLFFVLVGYGALGAIFGQTMAFLISGIIGFSLFFLFFYRNYKTEDIRLDLRLTLKMMLGYGLPLYLSALLAQFFLEFNNFMIAFYCSDFMIGNYKAALNFSVILTFFTVPITTVLFPAFSKISRENEMRDLKIMFRFSVKYAALLTIPAATAIMALSEPLTFILFSKGYEYTPLFLSLIAMEYLNVGLGRLSVGSFINGQGKTEVNMKLTILTLAIGLPLSLLFIPKFGILGLIATTLVARVSSLIMGLWWTRKHYGVTVEWVSSIKIYLTSGVAAVTTYMILLQLNFHEWMKLLVGGTLFMSVFLMAASFMGAVNKTDVDNLREMLNSIGPLYSLFNIPLKFIEKILTLKDSILIS